MSTEPRSTPSSRRPSVVPRTRGWGVALAFVTAAISGVSIFTNGYAVRHVTGPGAFTTAKNLVAAALLAVALGTATARRSEDGWTPPRSRRQALGLVLVGVIGGSIPFLLFFEGLGKTGSTDAAFIHKTLVVWVAVLAVTVLRERVGWPHAAAIVALVVGQALLTKDLTRVGLGAGEVMILAATLLWAVEVVVAKRLLADLSALTVGVARLAIGIVVLLGWLGATDQLGTLAGYGSEQWRWILLTGALLAAYVATWYAALARAQAVDVTAVLVVGAIVTAGLQAVVDGVSLQPDLIGLGLVAIGGLVVAAVPSLGLGRHRATEQP